MNLANWHLLMLVIRITSFFVRNHFVSFSEVFVGCFMLVEWQDSTSKCLKSQSVKIFLHAHTLHTFCIIFFQCLLQYSSDYSLGFTAIVIMFALSVDSTLYIPTCFFNLVLWTWNCTQNLLDRYSRSNSFESVKIWKKLFLSVVVQ